MPAEISKDELQGASSAAIDLARIKLEQERLYNLMTLVIIVLFVGFLGISIAVGAFLIEAFRSKEAAYTEVVKETQKTNILIQTMCKKEECL